MMKSLLYGCFHYLYSIIFNSILPWNSFMAVFDMFIFKCLKTPFWWKLLNVWFMIITILYHVLGIKNSRVNLHFFWEKEKTQHGTSHKTRWRHAVNPHTQGIAAILLPILSSLHLQDLWLACKRSRVQNQDRISWLLFLLLSSFFHPSLPSQIRTHNVLGIICIK